jgi:hypothetical protein
MSKEVMIKDPSDLITLAIEKGAELDKLEKLLNIQREYNKDIARQQYHEAMAAFKADPPMIDKDKRVAFGQGKAAYKHASLFNVVDKCSAKLSQHGLSAAWTTANLTGGTISVTCRVTHRMGHGEETTLSANADVTGNKNPIQAVGSTVTYLQRYTLLALLGLATQDQDDDGNAVVTEFISEKQYSQLLDLINDKEADEAKFCDFMGVQSLTKLPASQFQKALAAINAKKKK